ncbi:MAG: hypothetical protein JWP91_651 [Fibrobacteres bacterium]|nr:hypothetical protein [Fibrobacterota bacterium]
MKLIDSNLACPSCQAALQPKVLACPHCDIKVEGPFQLNEFATLAQDDLHFLRIFVRCEGRIRDMESALGLSYPTIRARLTALKHKLAGEEGPDGKDADAKAAEEVEAQPDAGQILAQLQAGEIPFDEAMKRIKRLRAKP